MSTKSTAAIISMWVVASLAASARAGGACRAYNAALYTTGNTYQLVNRIAEKGMHDFTQIEDYKVMGPASFRGHKAIDVRTHTVVSISPSSRSSVIADVFYGASGKFFYLFGDRSQIGAEGYSDPPFSYPKRYVLNVPYTDTTVQHTVGMGTAYSFTLKKTTTFLGMERIKVPAGTFMACKMKTEVSSSANGLQRTIDYDWVVASGRYAGLGIKSSDLKSVPGSPAAVVMKKVALSVRLNGK